MKNNETLSLEKAFSDMTKVQLEAEISEMSGALGEAQVRNNLNSEELNKVFVQEKTEQIQKIQSMYGGIKIGEGFEQAVAKLARFQGMESVALADLESLQKAIKSIKELRISIDIAKKIMKQKQQSKGRRQ